MPTIRICLLALLVAVTGACATTSADGPRRDTRVLTTEEIRASTATDAYRLVEQERPQWLRMPRSITMRPTAGGQMAEPPALVLYVDGIRHGTAADLRNFRISALASMRYLSPSEATTRFGTNHAAGAILVTMY